MLKKLFLILLLLATPVLADEINMTPQNTFSGYNNNSSNSSFQKNFNNKKSIKIRDERAEIMKPKSVREMGDITPSNQGPMNYSQFPKNYDSSNMMPMSDLQNNMRNMYMGY